MHSQNKNNPLVSVCISTYNRAHYLPMVIECWLEQTFKDFELIISDDASSDGTQKIYEEYAKKDSRIRYYRQKKNLNIPANQKFVLSQARGKYVNWAADDDLYDKRFLEDCLELFEKDPQLIMVFTDMVDIDKNGRQFSRFDPAKYVPLARDTYERLKEFILFYHDDGKVWLYCGLWKREVILDDDPLFGLRAKDDYPPYYWGFDIYFVFRNLAKGHIGFVPQTRFFRRSRVLEEYRKPRPFAPRMFFTFIHRLEKIFRSPYFWYIMLCIATIKELSLFQRFKLILWNFFVMVRLFFKRKI